MPDKFKIGVRVKIINTSYFNRKVATGDLGTIIKLPARGKLAFYTVRLDRLGIEQVFMREHCNTCVELANNGLQKALEYARAQI